MTAKLTTGLILTAIVSLLTIENAHAAGYEKSITWGGKEAAYAGAAVPWVQGADALYYNPAGLIKDKVGNEFSIQLSPTESQTTGPIDTNNDQATSLTTLSLPGALIYDRTFSDSFAAGAGFYTSAGSKTEFDNVALPGTLMGQSTVYTNIGALEFGLGAAYKVVDKLKIGLAYRVVMAQASFGVVNYTDAAGLAPTNLEVNNAQATNYSSFKLGAQYQLAEKTMLGLTYRSETPLVLAGNFAGNATISRTQVAPIDQTQAKIHTVIPMAVDLGISQDYENWRAMAQYTWTQYSRIGEVPIEGVVSVGGSTIVPAVNLPARWSDEHDIRLAGDYHGWSWPIRFGYMLSTQVTDPYQARVTFYAPGLGHTLTVGTGQTWDVFGNPLTFNVAGEVERVSGSSGFGAVGTDASGNSTRTGTITDLIYALHTGLTYAF